MEKLISQIESILSRKLEYCDVGASGGIPEPWNSYARVINTLRFEPNREEYLKIKGQRKNDKLFNVGLYKESGEIDFYITKSPQCSSVYEPNIELLRGFSIVEWFEVVERELIDVVSLDELYAQKFIENIDFIKIDAQGAELDIIKGAREVLSNRILGMSVEVEFLPMYKNQPLFAEVDDYIRNTFQLELQDLTKCYCKYTEGIEYGSSKGKLLCGDALYFISPASLMKRCDFLSAEESGEQIIMACIIGCIYGYVDYVLCLLSMADDKRLLSRDVTKKFRLIVMKYGRGIRYRYKGAGSAEKLFRLLGGMFMNTYKGWKTDGHYLGSRKRYGIFT